MTASKYELRGMAPFSVSDLIDLSRKSLQVAQEAERSFNTAVALKREGKCWGCRHTSHTAGECPERPTFAWDSESCECSVHEGQL